MHGEPVPDPRDIWGMPLDLAALEHGGVVVDCSDMYFSHRHNLNQPTAPASMADGWETRRRRGPGNDWVVVRLAEEGVLRIAEIDTRFFKGNAPRSFSLDGKRDGDFHEVLAETQLRPHVRHRFRVPAHDPVTHIRLNIYPDGGVARLRLFGSLSERGAETLAMRWVDSLAPSRAEAELLTVCGSQRWARDMMASRPFGSMPAMRDAAARTWAALGREDRLEAFAAHPPILQREGGLATAWSRDEQSASSAADLDVREALAQGNRAYEERFGYVFLISATGLTANEILTSLQTRLGNDPDTELDVAAAEQAKIIELRLAKLVSP